MTRKAINKFITSFIVHKLLVFTNYYCSH